MTAPQERPHDRSDDSGFTLVEMLFAMGIFGVLLAIFSTAITDFSASTVRTFQTSDQSTQARIVFDLFDKQVRAASAINRPALIGNNWYVEFRSEAIPPSMCTQWVLRTDTGELAVRTWLSGATAMAPAWRTLSTYVVNTSAQQPFTFSPSTTTAPMQRLTVSLRYQQGTGPVTVSSSSFTARNTTTSTATNADSDGDGLSDTQVCDDFTGWRP